MQKDYWPQMTLMRQMTTDEYFAMRHKTYSVGTLLVGALFYSLDRSTKET